MLLKCIYKNLVHLSKREEVCPGDPGPNFIAMLTISKVSVLTEAGNSVLTGAGNSVLETSVFHWLAGNFGVCACALNVTRHSTLTQPAQIFGACRKVANHDHKRRIR